MCVVGGRDGMLFRGLVGQQLTQGSRSGASANSMGPGERKKVQANSGFRLLTPEQGSIQSMRRSPPLGPGNRSHSRQSASGRRASAARVNLGLGGGENR